MYSEPPIYSEDDPPRVKARKNSLALRKEKNDTSGGSRRSVKREHIIIKWILRITHMDKNSNIDFADWIQDGRVLSNVMTTLCFNSVEIDPYAKKQKLMGMSETELRIRQIIQQIRDYGVEEKFVFKVEDVMDKRRPQKVVRCLEEVAKLVSACMRRTVIRDDTDRHTDNAFH